MRRGSSSLPIAVDLPTGTPSRGFFTAGDLGAMDVPLRNVRLGCRRAVHWELVGDQTTMVFTGRVAADSIVGTITEGSSEGMFSLRRVSASTDKPYRSTPIRFNNGGVELVGRCCPRGRRAGIPPSYSSTGRVPKADGPVASSPTMSPVEAWSRSSMTSAASANLLATGKRARSRTSLGMRRWRPICSPADRTSTLGAWASMATARVATSRPWWRPATPTCGGSSMPTATLGRSPEQDLFRVESALAKRFDGQQLRDAMSLYREFVDVARGGLSRDQLHADQAKYRSAEWYDALGLPDDQDWIWEWYRGVGNTDNRRAWAAIDVPVLLVYGERDEVVPPRKSIDAITGLLAANHDTAVTVRLLGGADHALRVPPADPLGWPRYADGFPTLIVDWIHGLRQ